VSREKTKNEIAEVLVGEISPEVLETAKQAADECPVEAIVTIN